jgi:hypothetical protein
MLKKVRHRRLYVRAELHAGNRKAQKERAVQERWVVRSVIPAFRKAYLLDRAPRSGMKNAAPRPGHDTSHRRLFLRHERAPAAEL